MPAPIPTAGPSSFCSFSGQLTATEKPGNKSFADYFLEGLPITKRQFS